MSKYRNELAELIATANTLSTVAAYLLVDKPYGGKEATIHNTVQHLSLLLRCLEGRIENVKEAAHADALSC